MIFDTVRNAYFQIELPDYGAAVKDQIDPRDIVSLSITEEFNKSITGSFSLNDPSMVYGRILRFNATAKIQWGYKKQGFGIQSLNASKGGVMPPDFISKNYQRKGLQVLVMNPSGEGRQDGSVGFSCGFLSKGWFGTPQFKTYERGTKRSVVAECLKNMGALKTFIMFTGADIAYSSDSVERQTETDFAFLARLSQEWRCVFKMGYAQDGSTYGLFCQASMLAQAQPLIMAALGVLPNIATISWRGGKPTDLMAISYDWKNQEGENGEGDNVQTTIVNGKVTFQRFTMEGESVVVWTLNTAAVDQYVRAGNDIKPIMNARDFSDPAIKKFWTSAKQTTAPNGLGYTVNVKMFGNPALTAGMLVTLGEGFPAMLYRLPVGAVDPVQFVILKATHTLSQAGYFTDLEIVDVPTLSAVGVW